MDPSNQAKLNQLRTVSGVFKNQVVSVPSNLISYHDVSKKIKNIKEQKHRQHLYNSIKENFAKIQPSMIRNRFNYVPPKNSIITSYYFKLYENQQKFGSTIFNQYVQNQSLIHTLAIAPTQSGKTGSMLSIIHHAISHETHGVPIENVFIFTPHSSREWLLQTKERFPPSMSANIFHRNNFKKLIAAMQHKTNVLLILDEVQIAFKLGQTTFNLFNQLGFYDLHNLFQKNIKIVSFTATPNQLVQDFALWKNMASVLYMDVPDSYISHQVLLRSNRLRQMKDLTGFDKVTGTVNPEVLDNIREIISVVNNMETPKYHIIRTPRANLHLLTMQNFRQVFKDDLNQFILVSETTIQDFDQFISSPPSQHTFIFIKDKLRCAKTLEKAHIGVLYERFVNKPILDSIIQGLAGRLTGYHKNTLSVIFTHLPSIHYYYLSKHTFDTTKRKPSAFYPI